MGIFSILGCTSNYQEYEAARSDKSEIASNGPFRIQVSSMNEVERPLIEAYIRSTFGRDLSFSKTAGAKFSFTFVSEETPNQYATWRDGTGLVEITSQAGDTLWMAEYNYKGGFEMSGFSVRTNSEAAKITVERLYAQFIRD
jgi:hypothetical protein